VAKRFLFMSFDPDAADAMYLADNDVPFLVKPFSTDALTEHVSRIVSMPPRLSR